jgi:hypothetical protein
VRRFIVDLKLVHLNVFVLFVWTVGPAWWWHIVSSCTSDTVTNICEKLNCPCKGVTGTCSHCVLNAFHLYFCVSVSSMGQVFCWEANSCLTSQVFHFSRDLNVHYRFHNSSPLVAVSSVHPPLYFLKIYFNIIFPSTRRSSKWSLSVRRPHQNSVCTCPASWAILH